MSSTPIDPSEIRVGDLIRGESNIRPGNAVEWRAQIDKDLNGWNPRSFDFFLLDRPAPAVEMPTEPTLGWVTFEDGEHLFGRWWLKSTALIGEVLGERQDQYIPRHVTAFTPTTVVPTDALDRLRKHLADSFTPCPAAEALLNAVDSANGSPS